VLDPRSMPDNRPAPPAHCGLIDQLRLTFRINDLRNSKVDLGSHLST
jgi:hypothetical protein